MNQVKISLSVLVLFLFLAGCSEDTNPTDTDNTGSTTYVGTVANGSESGSITLDVNMAKSNGTNGAVTGTLNIVSPSNSTVTLTGIYSNNALSVTGGSYTFSGVLTGNSFTGGYTGPNGSGQFNAQPSTNNSVKVFAGTYTSNTISGRHGTFNIVLDGTSLSGFSVSAGNGESTPLSGTLTGNNISLLGGIAVGTLNGTTVSGTYDNTQGDAGVWSGTQITP